MLNLVWHRLPRRISDDAQFSMASMVWHSMSPFRFLVSMCLHVSPGDTQNELKLVPNSIIQLADSHIWHTPSGVPPGYQVTHRDMVKLVPNSIIQLADSHIWHTPSVYHLVTRWHIGTWLNWYPTPLYTAGWSHIWHSKTPFRCTTWWPRWHKGKGLVPTTVFIKSHIWHSKTPFTHAYGRHYHRTRHQLIHYSKNCFV
jgi:hypothetical protein